MPVPPEPRYRIRVANKAVIIRDGALLVTTNSGPYGDFCMLPGGGQEWGEDAVTALRRECVEEIGCAVEVGALIGVRDYVADHHELAALDAGFHQQENFFACRLAPGAEPRVTDTGDEAQVGFAWLPLTELPASVLYPKILRTWLLADPDTRPIYLGEVN